MAIRMTRHDTQEQAQAYANAYRDSWGYYGVVAIVSYSYAMGHWEVLTDCSYDTCGDSED